jgi:hypothetical protein
MLCGSNAADAKHASDSRETDDSVLDVELSEQHNREPPVLVHASEYVEFLLGSFFSFFSGHVFLTVHDSAVEHVEQVHEDKGVIQETVMPHALSRLGIGSHSHLFSHKGVRHIEHGRSSVHENENDNNLVEHHRVDGSVHDWQDLVFGTLSSRSKLSRMGCFSGESNGSQHVHDQVDPQ